jgi:hypothetical protein
VETLLDSPQLVGPPDRLNMTLFALLGFVAADPPRFVETLSGERLRVGGHELRPLCVVGPPGPSEAGLGYTRHFPSFARVIQGIGEVLSRLEAPRV